MSEKDAPPRRPAYQEPVSGTTKIAETLVPQMGSSGKFIGRDEIDQRKFAVFESSQEQVALFHFDYRARIDKNRYYESLVNWILNSGPSLEHGLGRRQVIQTIQAASGGSVIDVAEKPGFVGRHFTQRDWKEKAQREGKVVRE